MQDVAEGLPGRSFLQSQSLEEELSICTHNCAVPVQVDVTNYIKKARSQQVSFQLSRIVRFNANAQLPGDSLTGNSVTFGSREAGSAAVRPELLLYYI